MFGDLLEGPFSVCRLLDMHGRKVLGEEIPKGTPERGVVINDKDIEHGPQQVWFGVRVIRGDVGRL